MLATVITPTLNAREYLCECIESARMNESKEVQSSMLSSTAAVSMGQ